MMNARRLPLIASLCLGWSLAWAGGACPVVTRVGVSDLGYAAYREDGQIKGLSADVIGVLARRTGCKFELQWFPRQRLFVELEAGHIDMTMAALRTPERDAYARHLPYAYLQYELLLQAGQGRHYASLADFVSHGKGRLNITRGILYDAAIEAQLTQLAALGRLEVVNDYETVFGKLEVGRADGTLATPPVYGRYLHDGALKGRVLVMSIAEAEPRLTGAYLSKKTMAPEVRRYYAAALKEMVAEQVLPRLYARYFDEATVKRTFQPGAGPLLTALSAPD